MHNILFIRLQNTDIGGNELMLQCYTVMLRCLQLWCTRPRLFARALRYVSIPIFTVYPSPLVCDSAILWCYVTSLSQTISLSCSWPSITDLWSWMAVYKPWAVVFLSTWLLYSPSYFLLFCNILQSLSNLYWLCFEEIFTNREKISLNFSE